MFYLLLKSLNHELAEVDENEEEERLFADFEQHQQLQRQQQLHHQHSLNQLDSVELKILSNDNQQFDEIHQFNTNQQLSSHHKSLSYGNLSSTTPQINEPINEQQTNNNNQAQLKHLISKSMHGKLLKNSPSLELTSASNKASGGYMTKINNSSSNNSNNLNVTSHNGANNNGVNNGGDHSGDNDSGISSMSSETTTAAVQNCNNNTNNTQKAQNTFGNMRNSTPTSLQIINANASNVNVSIPIINSSTYFNHNHNQYQMQRQSMQYSNHQFQQQQPQSHISNNGSKSIKSVLETLV